MYQNENMSTYSGDIRPGSNIALITVQGVVTFNFRHVDTCNTKKDGTYRGEN